MTSNTTTKTLRFEVIYMEGKHTNRKKDKLNDYTLSRTNDSFVVAFKDSNEKLQEICVTEETYDLFDSFELEDISYLNEVSRHYEHSVLSEQSLNARALHPSEPIEDVVMKHLEYQALNIAILELPDIQRRRLLLHFYYGLTYESIAKNEGCSKSAIEHSINAAINNLRKTLSHK